MDDALSQIQLNAIIIVSIIKMKMLKHVFTPKANVNEMINRNITRRSIKSIYVSNSKYKLEQNFRNSIFFCQNIKGK